MSCKHIYKGKSYTKEEFKAVVYALPLQDAARFNPSITALPSFPFSKSWHELAFKRILRHAVENGYERVTWDTGETNAERFDLSKHIAEVHYSGSNLVARDHDGNDVITRTGVKPEDLPDLIGKEAAERLMEQEPQGTLRSLEGEDLKVGGEGMKGFYDKILPASVNKYVKKWGSRVERGSLNNNEDTDVWSLNITDAMRESVMQGQPLFKKAKRGDKDYLTEVLPYAHSEDLFEKASSSINDGMLELNEEATEVVRRLLADIGQDASSFYGVTISKQMLNKLAKRVGELIPQYKAAGMSSKNIRSLASVGKNLKKLAEQDDYGIVYVFDDAVAEERVHQQDLSAGRTDAQAMRTLKESPFMTNSGAAFKREYPTLTDRDKVSEIAAKLATGQEKRYGWDKVENFEEQKAAFLNAWADGILRNNAKFIEANGIEAFQKRFKTIYENSTINREGTAGQARSAADRGSKRSGEAAGREGESFGVDRQEAKPDQPERPAASDRNDNRIAEQAEEVGDIATDNTFERQEKLSSLPKTLRSYGIDAVDVAYTVYGDTEATADAVKLFEENGVDSSIRILDSIKEPDAEHTILAGIVYDTLLNHSLDLTGLEAAAVRAKADKFLAGTSKRLVKAGRYIRAVQLMQHGPSVSVIAGAEAIAEESGSPLTDEEIGKFAELGRQLENAQAETITYKAQAKALEKENKSLTRRLKNALSKKLKTRAYRGRRAIAKQITEQNAEALKAAEDVLNGLLNNPLRQAAWHGSPHVFDKFTTAKIGTGEGAQVYGWGMYFAGKEEVADYYREALTDPEDVPLQINGKPLDEVWTQGLRDRFPELYKGLSEDDVNILDGILADLSGIKSVQDANNYFGRDRERLPLYRKLVEGSLTKPDLGKGAKYKVDLKPAEDEYLLWDKPLSEQSEKVKKALQKIPLYNSGSLDNLSGAEVYGQTDALEAQSSPEGGSQKAASEYLKSLGIRGIKYLDGSSRGKGEGSYNYVIFDDADVEITEILRQSAEVPVDPKIIEALSTIASDHLIRGLAEDSPVLPDAVKQILITQYGDDLVSPIWAEVYSKAMRKRDQSLRDFAKKQQRAVMSRKLEDAEFEKNMEKALDRELPQNLSDTDILDILGISRDITRRRRAIEKMHRLLTGIDFTRIPAELRQMILGSGSSELTTLAAELHAANTSVRDFYVQMAKLGAERPELFDGEYTKAKAQEAFTAGKDLLAEAKQDIKDHQAEVKQAEAEKVKEIRDIQVAEMQARERLDQRKRDIADEYEKLTNPRRYYAKKVYQTGMDLMRNLTLSAEASFLLRQGGKSIRSEIVEGAVRLLGGGNKPVESKPYVRGALRTILPTSIMGKETGNFGEVAYADNILGIENHPLYPEAVKAGLDFSTAGKIGTGVRVGEEQLQSEAVAMMVDWLNKNAFTANTIAMWPKAVQRFDKGMAVFLDNLRMRLYERLSTELKDQGYDPKKDRKEFEDLVKRINTATARPNKMKNLTQKGVDMAVESRLFLAPSYTVAKWQDMGADIKNIATSTIKAVAFQGLPKGTQRIMLRRAISSYGALTAQYAMLAAILGVAISFDPDDDDFLKVKIGDARYDLTQGNRAELRYIGRMIKHYDDPNQAFNLTARYGRTRLNIAPAFALNAWYGKDVTGKEFSLKDPKRYAGLVAPLTYMNAFEAYSEYGGKGVLQTLPFDFVGIGVQLYPESARSLKEERKVLEEQWRKAKDAKDEKKASEVKKQIDELIPRIKTREIIERADKGKSKSEKDLISTLTTYAQAVGTDPMQAAKLMFKGESIRKLENGTIIVERMSLKDSQGVKRKRGAGVNVRLDHTIPLGLGGDNSEENLSLVTTKEWESFTPIENLLMKAHREKKISIEEAQEMVVQFKQGKITVQEVRDKIEPKK